MDKIKSELRDMKKKQHLESKRQQVIEGKLDLILQTLKEFKNDELDGNKRKRLDTKVDSQAPHLSSLRPLNEMNVIEVVTEWMLGFDINNIKFRPLSELVAEKIIKKKKIFDDSLTTTIARRRYIVEKTQRKALELGSIEESIQWMESKRMELGSHKGKPASLYKLWKFLKECE
eukprot:g3149.t1